MDIDYWGSISQMDDSDEKARERRQQDFDDLERERAGRNGSRINRFFRNEDIPAHAQAADADDGLAEFMILAGIEEQARTLERIAGAEIACERALIEARKQEQQAREELDRLRQNATITADGRTVFLSADGKRAVDDHGNELTPDEIAATSWKQGATTLEQWQEGNARLEQARQKTQEIEDYQQRLKEGRDRIEGGERLTTDELKGIEDDLEAMPDSVREHLSDFQTPSASHETRASAAKEFGEGQGIEGDPLSPAFARAVLGPEEIAAIKNSPAAAPKPS